MGVEIFGSVAEVPGWDALLPDRDAFYESSAWLQFADADGEADARYAVNGDPRAPTTVLPLHLSHDETNLRYTPSREVRALASCEHVLATLGGRRGYRSGVLTQAPEQLATMLDRSLDSFDVKPDGWWWPYLEADEVLQVVDTQNGRRRPGVALLNADCVLDVPGRDFDDYLKALSTKRRYTVRREMKRFAGSGLTVRRERLADCWERGGRLAANVQRKYGHDHPPELMAEVLKRQARWLDDLSVLFACYDGSDMIAFSLAYRWRSELVVRLVGFDYARLRDSFEYSQVLFYAPLVFCYEEGLDRIHLGTAGLGAKILRGAQLRPLWAVYHCPCSASEQRPSSNLVLNGRANTLAQQLPHDEAAKFTRELTTYAALLGGVGSVYRERPFLL
jgi:hypothetical protein